MKVASIGLALAGLALMTVLIGWVGFAPLWQTTVSVGWSGFAVLIGWQMLMFVVLGLAWTVLIPTGERRLGVMIWGRMVRDAAANCLPFSPIGGFVFGARAITLHGFGWPLAGASTIVDVTAEVLAQIGFAALGLGALLLWHPDTSVTTPLTIGLTFAVVVMGVFILAQRGGVSLFVKLGRRIAGRGFGEAGASALQDELRRIYARVDRLGLAWLIHLAGWIMSAVEGWIAFRLVGADIGFAAALTVEALLRVVLAVAFVVPANVGVQEAAYSGFGAMFGVSPEMALAVSLLRRARDLAVGVPILLVWQGFEARRLRMAAR